MSSPSNMTMHNSPSSTHRLACSSFDLNPSNQPVDESASKAMFNLVFLVTISVLCIGIIPGCGLLLFEHMSQHANDTNSKFYTEICLLIAG